MIPNDVDPKAIIRMSEVMLLRQGSKRGARRRVIADVPQPRQVIKQIREKLREGEEHVAFELQLMMLGYIMGSEICSTKEIDNRLRAVSRQRRSDC